MLRHLAERGGQVILIDFKGDMADDKNTLDRAFGATVIAPPHQPVPLDVLAIADRSGTGIALAAQRLRDSLATLDDLCRFELFRPELAPAAFFRRSWIIRLTADLPDLVKVSVVTLLTDALDRYLNSLPEAPTDGAGNRALRALCVIDEAHRILGSSLPGLSGLIRLSRSKGGCVMLISQGPDDFSGEDDEFLNEMGLVVAFRTNADARAVRRILGPGANLATLEKGQAWVKAGAEPAPRRVVAWR